MVDSGGQGLYRLFQGALLHVVGRVAGGRGTRSLARGGRAQGRPRSSPTPTRASATRRCSSSSPTARQPSMSTRSATTSSRSASPCSSPATPGRSRSTSTTSGRTWSSATDCRRNAQPDQRREPRQPGARRPRDAGRRLHRGRAIAGPDAVRTRSGRCPRDGRPGRDSALGVVAVVAGDGLAAIFRTSGSPRSSRVARRPIRAPGSCSTRSSRCRAREIILLPNNPNVVLAARQVARMTDRPVVVVPTRNAAEGFAALLALDPQSRRRRQCRPDDRGRRGRSRRSS